MVKNLTWVFFLFFIKVNAQYFEIKENFNLVFIENIAQVCESNSLAIEQIITNPNLNFASKSSFNFGPTYVDRWLKFSLSNNSKNSQQLFLTFESIVNDSIVLYKVQNGKLIEKIAIGEVLPFSEREIKHRNPIIPIKLLSQERAQYFLKSTGNGQPMNLSALLQNTTQYHMWDVEKLFFLGLLYGVLGLIVILNFSFFLITNEKIYVLFASQIIFTMLTLAYFDGFVYQFIFPNNGYWVNQTAAIGMCLTFVFSNLFASLFFNLKALLPWAFKAYKYSTVMILIVLACSFIHPVGFNFFIVFMTGMTSVIAVLLFVSILTLQSKGLSTYIFALLATICLIIFGTVYQLYVLGVLPETFFTHHAMHITVVLQSIFLALAVNDKFRNIKAENDQYQLKLMDALNLYSQNLISNIEAERQRIAADIHDGFGQNLLVMRNKILYSLKKNKLSKDYESVLYSLLEVTTQTLEEARSMSYDLRPPILNTLGLTTAIEVLVNKIKSSSHIDIQLNMPESIDGIIHKDLEINIYRILQESFNNVIKHAHANEVSLMLLINSETLHISLQDNGVGYNQKTVVGGQGLLGIQERVSLLKGQIKIQSEMNEGTNIEIFVPIINKLEPKNTTANEKHNI